MGRLHSNSDNEKSVHIKSTEEEEAVGKEDKMLSRVAFRAVPIARPNAIVVRTGATATTTPAAVEPKWKSPLDGPERDYVNWPRRQRPIEKPPVRLKMFPEEWFTALHSETGATGPYVFLVGFGTYLASKEIYVFEHEFYCGLALFTTWAMLVKNVGPIGLHFFQREVLFTFCTTVCSHPGVEFCDCVIHQLPFLNQDFTFCHPFIRNNLDFCVPFSECSYFIISLFVGGHFEGCCGSIIQDLQVLKTSSFKSF